jgi:DNA-binding LytR/AlgR family response regulator
MQKPFFVWQNKVLKSVSPQDVAILYTEGNYTKIVLSNDKHYMIRSSLSGVLKKLPPEMFIKTHRSFAVSIFYIKSLARDHLIIGEVSIPISRQYYKTVIEQLNVIGTMY